MQLGNVPAWKGRKARRLPNREFNDAREEGCPWNESEGIK